MDLPLRLSFLLDRFCNGTSALLGQDLGRGDIKNRDPQLVLAIVIFYFLVVHSHERVVVKVKIVSFRFGGFVAGRVEQLAEFVLHKQSRLFSDDMLKKSVTAI